MPLKKKLPCREVVFEKNYSFLVFQVVLKKKLCFPNKMVKKEENRKFLTKRSSGRRKRRR
jgi:hypothetical protein